jgi:5'(3')-deoxyribonucleotidase
MKKPEVYLDMDGVLADFFTEYAKLAGIESGNYRDIPPAKTDPTLNKMVGTDFFARLPKFPSADQLVSLIVKTYGHYHICSSPLRGDYEGSEKYKKIWIQEHLDPQPVDVVITPNKAKWAKQKDGTPNILIDDRGSNISSWEAAGGIGIKYQADEDNLQTIVKGLARANKIIKGEEKHDPQRLVSKDRSLPVATQDDPASAADLKEWTDGATTNTAAIGNIGGNPAVILGKGRGNKSYTGTPGRSGTKAPPQPKVKQPKGPNGTAKNALDMKGSNIFGQPIKR